MATFRFLIIKNIYFLIVINHRIYSKNFGEYFSKMYSITWERLLAKFTLGNFEDINS
jgi:hypothetical protein